MTTRSILVYTGGEIIGDGLIKLPYMAALREAYPEAKIHWWSDGPSVYQTVLKEVIHPYIDRHYAPPLKPYSWCRRYDLIIDTQKKFLKSLALKLIPHKTFLSTSANFLFSSYKPTTPFPHHDVLRLLALTSLANTPLFFTRPTLNLPQSYYDLTSELLPPGNRYIGLVVGAGQARKKWPLRHFIALAKALAQQKFTPVFILGPQEQEDYKVLKQELPKALYPLQSPRAPSSPLFTIAVAKRFNLAVSNDCGGGHMMACADIPLVSLFGPTDPDKVAPIVAKGRVIKAQDYGNDREVSAIPLEAVLQAVQQIISLNIDNNKRVSSSWLEQQ